jgi:hypothetical protein
MSVFIQSSLFNNDPVSKDYTASDDKTFSEYWIRNDVEGNYGGVSTLLSRHFARGTFFFVVKDTPADATDAPQSWGLLWTLWWRWLVPPPRPRFSV